MIMEAASLLAHMLVRFGVPEAAPLVLADAVASNGSQRAKSDAMDVLIQALVDSAETAKGALRGLRDLADVT